MGEAAKREPTRQDFDIYDDGNPWFFDIQIEGLEVDTLVGATITAKFNATRGDDPAELTITTTPTGLADMRFFLGYVVPVRGKYDIIIALPGEPGRAYIFGEVNLMNRNTDPS